MLINLGGPTDPDTTTEVSVAPSTLFLDDFSGTLSTNWTSAGTVAAASSGGAVIMGSNTTVSATSYMRSVGTFLLRAASYLRSSFQLRFETAVRPNATRWWGYGLNQSSPTAAAPVLNGAVFELGYSDGNLYAVLYSAGVRNAIATLTRPTDGNLHKYEIWYRQSIIYWVIDGVVAGQTVAGSFPNLAMSTGMAIIIGQVNYTTAPAAAPVLVVSSATMADHSGTNRTVSDGVNPWLQATVKNASTAAAAVDYPLVVALHPSTATPAIAAGSNTIGAIGVGAITPSAYAYESTAIAVAISIKTSAGNLQELTISNPTSTAAYVKLYNKTTAPAPASDTPVSTHRLAATGSVGDTLILSWGPNGKRFSTGIAFGITGAAVKTDTTATVAGIQVSATYV